MLSSSVLLVSCNQNKTEEIAEESDVHQKDIDDNSNQVKKSKAEKTKTKVSNKVIQKLLNQMEANIKASDYTKLEKLYNDKRLKDNQEALALYEYANYLKNGERSYNASYNLSINVDPLYKGRLKDEITEAIMDNSFAGTSIYDPLDKSEWENNYNTIKSAIKYVELAKKEKSKKSVVVKQPIEPYPPQIGMTDYEVLEESTWGKPTRVNTTVTANGKKEQWVYPNNKYLYFEDGYLVSIQY